MVLFLSHCSLHYFPLEKLHQKLEVKAYFVCKYSSFPCLEAKQQQKYVTLETPALNIKNYK